MLIQPKYLKLSELLNNRLFRIPSYQRAYSWETKQRQDLFEDIRRLEGADDDTTHFLATMVGLSRGKKTIVTDEFQVLEVVDGQQRLTTIIILYKALAEALNRKDKKEKALAEEIESLLVKDDKLSLLLLQTNHDSSNYFVDYLRTGKHPDPGEAKILADKLLLQAMVDCENFVEGWAKKRIKLAAILKNRLTVIFHEIENEVAVYTVFEVLNSRGLDVAWLDRLKSVLMGIAFQSDTGNKKEIIGELHSIWGDIYACVGLHQGRSAEALRFAATLMSDSSLSKVLGEEDAVETLRAITKNSAKGAIDVSKWIFSVVRAVDKLVTDRRRAAVTKIAHARLLAVAIELREDLGKKRQDLIAAWEKVTFRIFGMCRKDARTRVGDYVRLARRIALDKPSFKEALVEIRELAGEEFDIDKAIATLRNTDCYEGWEEELRYFLSRYEEYLAIKEGQALSAKQWEQIWQTSPANSIEHICPQSDGSHKRSNRRIFVHRLGNLVLLPPRLNSKLSNRPPADKVDAYAKTGLIITAEITSKLNEWDVQAVQKREEQLLKWAKTEWGD